MTEQEAKEALFNLRLDYMSLGPNERLELYDEYRKKRAQIKNELARIMYETRKAKQSIFDIRYNYAMLPPKEKESRYEEYRSELKEAKTNLAHIKVKGIEKK